MMDLVGLHPFQDRAALLIMGRDLGQMVVEMILDLTFGLDHEAETPFVARQTRQRAQREGAGIPERIEQALAVAEFLQPLFAPGQMVVLLLGRALQTLTGLGQLGGERLALIERLGTDLARVVDAHQACHMPTLILAQFGLHQVGGRILALGDARASEHRA